MAHTLAIELLETARYQEYEEIYHCEQHNEDGRYDSNIELARKRIDEINLAISALQS